MDKILRRIKLIFSTGLTNKWTQSSCDAEFSAGELLKNIDFAQGYGLEVYPLPGSKAVTIFNGGDRSQGITITATDKRYTHTLQPSEVMLYDDKGQFVHLKTSGIDINSTGDINITAGGSINMNATTINLN
jgi:phage gp45-like